MNRKRVRRLMRVMGLRAIYRKPRTSRAAPEQRVYPYLLEKARITRPNQVWAADITYIPMARGFLYLVAIMGLAQPVRGGLAAHQHSGGGILRRRSGVLHAPPHWKQSKMPKVGTSKATELVDRAEEGG